jgi:methionyl-tRNA formyltransferase
MMLEPFLQECAPHVRAIVTVRTNRSASMLRKILQVMRVAGWRYTILKLLLFSRIRVDQRLGKYPTIQSLCKRYDIAHEVWSSIRSEEARTQLAQIHPEFVISVLFERIIPSSIIELPSCAALNLHPALLPSYAGVAPTFWVLSHGEAAGGVTIHYLASEIDAGDIVFQKEIKVRKGDSVHQLYLRCCEAGGALLKEVASTPCADLPRSIQNADRRTYFSQPTSEGYQRLRAHGYSLFSITDLLQPSGSSRSEPDAR